MQSRKYAVDNKEKIQTYRSTKINCACGGCYTLLHKAEHLRSTTHTEFEHTGNTKHVPDDRTECLCGGSYTNNHKHRHFETGRHRKYLELDKLEK